MSEKKLREGFICEKCGAEHKFPAYVYSHWRELLTHTCDCGAQHEICAGAVNLIDEKETR